MEIVSSMSFVVNGIEYTCSFSAWQSPRGRSRNFERGGGGGVTFRGAAPGRVREGGTPPTQLGGMGERCKLPHGGLGEANAFCVVKPSKTTQKVQYKYRYSKYYRLYNPD